MKILKTSFLLFFLLSCAERKKSDNNQELIGALLFLQGQCPSPTPVASIGAATRVELNFAGCTSTSLNGFVTENLSLSGGIRGTGSNSRLASLGTYGDKKVNIEVTFTLNSAGASLDVIGLGLSSSASISGPGLRISESTIVPFNHAGTTDTFTGTAPVTPLNTEKTYCLELHNESPDVHAFGWAKSCAELTDAEKGSYPFDKEIPSSFPGKNIGFVLNNSTIKKIIVSTGNIGTSGSLQF